MTSKSASLLQSRGRRVSLCVLYVNASRMGRNTVLMRFMLNTDLFAVSAAE
jgi:hypothetical protein